MTLSHAWDESCSKRVRKSLLSPHRLGRGRAWLQNRNAESKYGIPTTKR